MNRVILLIGIGSFLGGICRYYTQQFVSRIFPSPLPYGTLTVNLAGCFLIGLLYGLFERGNILTPEWRLFLTTGLCGGYTTFSSFSYESIALIQDGEFFYLALYIGISVIAGLASTYAGMLMIKSI